MKEYWQEIRALMMRWVRRLSREKFSMLFTLVQPMLFWLIFFGNLFQRAADTQVTQAPNYISFLAAGVVVMTVLNNGLAGGVDGGRRPTPSSFRPVAALASRNGRTSTETGSSRHVMPIRRRSCPSISSSSGQV